MAFEFNRNFDISFVLSKQKMILFILTVVLSLLFALGAYKSQKKKVRMLEKKIKEEKALNKMVEDIKLQEKQFTKYSAEFAEKDAALIVEEISEFARASGVKISSLAPQKRIDSGILRILPFDLEVKGLYHQLGDFLSRIESSTIMLHVVRVNLSRAPVPRKKNKRRRGKREENRDGMLSAKIVINAVFILAPDRLKE